MLKIKMECEVSSEIKNDNGVFEPCVENETCQLSVKKSDEKGDNPEKSDKVDLEISFGDEKVKITVPSLELLKTMQFMENLR